MSQYEKFRLAVNNISAIPDDDWKYLDPFLHIKQFEKNDYYLKAGEIENQIGYINKGSFRLYYINKKGDEINSHFYLENEFVVEYCSLITKEPSRQYIQAMESSEVVLLPKYNKVMEIYPESYTWTNFARVILEKVYLDMAERCQDFLFRNVEERYLRLLEQRPEIFQRVSLSNIASYLGIQPQSLSRLRKRISKM